MLSGIKIDDMKRKESFVQERKLSRPMDDLSRYGRIHRARVAEGIALSSRIVVVGVMFRIEILGVLRSPRRHRQLAAWTFLTATSHRCATRVVLPVLAHIDNKWVVPKAAEIGLAVG